MSLNGHKKTRDLDALLERRRKQLELARINAELRLRKPKPRVHHHGRPAQPVPIRESSEGFAWLDGYSELIDRVSGPDRDFLFPFSTANDRRYGANWPFWRTTIEHARLRAAARFVVTNSPLAGGALSALTAYAVGEGMPTTASAVNASVPRILVDTVNHWLEEFADINNWYSRQCELFGRGRRDGEFFLRLFPRPDGTCNLRIVEPEYVMEPPGESYERVSFGVITDPEDTLDVEGYWVAYDGNAGGGEFVPIANMLHLKENVDETVKRGLTDFCFDVLDYFKNAAKLIEGLAVGSAIQANIAGIRQHQSATSGMASDFGSGQADYEETVPFTGSTRNVQRITPGTMLDIDSGQEYVVPPFATNVAGFTSVVQAVLRAVAVKWNAPEWLVSADASNNNMASSIVAESPFVKRMKVEQRRYARAFQHVSLQALKHYCRTKGGIRVNGETFDWETLTHLLKFETTPPTVETRNKGEEASMNREYIQLGVKSRQQAARELGLDWETQEKENEEYERKHGDQGVPADQAGGGGLAAGLGGGGDGEKPEQGQGQQKPEQSEQPAGDDQPEQPTQDIGSALAGMLGESRQEVVDRLRLILESGKPQKKFSSTQFNLPEPIAGAILAAGKRIPTGDLAADGLEDRPHVTVKYGIHTDDAAGVVAAVGHFQPVKVRFGGISLFKGDEHDVVKIDVISDDLHRLNGLIRDGVECTDTYPTYQPHVTIAYVKPGLGEKYVGKSGLEDVTLVLSDLVFSNRDRVKTVIPLGHSLLESLQRTPHPDVPIPEEESLAEADATLMEAGKTGQFKDKANKNYCLRDGKRVACSSLSDAEKSLGSSKDAAPASTPDVPQAKPKAPAKAAKPKAEKLTPEKAAETVKAALASPGGLSDEQKQSLVATLVSLTAEQIKDVRAKMGLDGPKSGTKQVLAEKLVAAALGGGKPVKKAEPKKPATKRAPATAGKPSGLPTSEQVASAKLTPLGNEGGNVGLLQADIGGRGYVVKPSQFGADGVAREAKLQDLARKAGLSSPRSQGIDRPDISGTDLERFSLPVDGYSVHEKVPGKPVTREDLNRPAVRDAVVTDALFNWLAGNADRNDANLLVDGDRVHSIDFDSPADHMPLSDMLAMGAASWLPDDAPVSQAGLKKVLAVGTDVAKAAGDTDAPSRLERLKQLAGKGKLTVGDLRRGSESEKPADSAQAQAPGQIDTNEARTAIRKGIERGKLFKEGQDGMIPMGIVFQQAKKFAPELTQDQLHAELVRLAGERKVDLHEINEYHSLPQHEKDLVINQQGRPNTSPRRLYYVMLNKDTPDDWTAEQQTDIGKQLAALKDEKAYAAGTRQGEGTPDQKAAPKPQPSSKSSPSQSSSGVAKLIDTLENGKPKPMGNAKGEVLPGTGQGKYAATARPPAHAMRAAVNGKLPAETRPAYTFDEAVGLTSYGQWGDVNHYLRTGSQMEPEAAETHKLLQDAFARTPAMKDPVPVYRGVGFTSEEQAQEYLAPYLEAARSKTPLRHTGYVSTTTDEKYATSDYALNPLYGRKSGVVFEIQATKGVDMAPYNIKPDQQELLLNHQSEFQVDSVSQEGGVWRVKMKQVS